MMRRRALLPLWFMMPAGVFVTLLFVMPVLLTVVFSFTTMSSDTGILGNRYVVTDQSLRALRDGGLAPDLVDRLGARRYLFDRAGLNAVRELGLEAALAAEIERKLAGRSYVSERRLFADLMALKNRPRSFTERKAVSNSIARSVKNRVFSTAEEFRAGLAAAGIEVDDAAFDRLRDATSTGWQWTLENYRELVSSGFTGKIFLNTIIYVFFTLFFNVGFALVLALITFYMPDGPSKFFRAVWLIPRISPSVIYVMLWKWFTYDGGFMSYLLSAFGIPGQNWMMEYPWTFIVLLNGFVGASMGLIIFSSAMQAIPKTLLYAAEVDGAYPVQQVIRIVLPLMRWPILFITAYQTLSLLTSFEYNPAEHGWRARLLHDRGVGSARIPHRPCELLR